MNMLQSTKTLPWLFTPTLDLLAFLGSAILALILLYIGYVNEWHTTNTPDWLWITSILMIDVAHVYATMFRVYLIPAEVRKNPWLYYLTPVLAFTIGYAIYSESKAWFWTILAYLAVFHFIRQQYGWVMLYRARANETSILGKWIDTCTIYLATIYPLVYWHTKLPRDFHWMIDGDFISIPQITANILAPIYVLSLVTYLIYNLRRAITHRQYNPGKDIVVVTTAICWYVGIITFNSDYAFTVTNVIIHGIPYMVLVYWYYINQSPRNESTSQKQSYLIPFLATIWLLAYLEELCWDQGVWHDRPWLFGHSNFLETQTGILIPLLAVPQITHYILDGFVWRRKNRFELTEES